MKGGLMSWHKIILTIKDIAAGKNIILQEDFEKLWIDSGCPMEMALFCDAMPKYEQPGMEQSHYVSPYSLPYASSFISSYSAVPCKKPRWSPGDKSMAKLVGAPEAWHLLK
jgi:hypothetical protein